MSKPLIYKHDLWDAVDSETDPVSRETSFVLLDKGTYFLKVDSTVLGDLNVQFCDEKTIQPNPQGDLGAPEWFNVDFGGTVGETITVDGSVNEEIEIRLLEICHSYLRLKFTNDGGTGNITAYVFAQAEGA